MTPHEYLLTPENIRKEIARKLARIEALRRCAVRLTAAPRDVRVRTTPDPTYTQSILAEIADEEQAILRLQEALTRSLADVALYISLLPPLYLEPLELRYLEGLTWQDIADRLSYGISTLFRYHQKALALLPPPEDPA